MLFSDITYLCQQLEQENSRLAKKKIVHNFFKHHTPLENKITINFLSLSIENNNILFQLNEITIIKYIAEYLNIQLDKVKDSIKKTGDLGLYFNQSYQDKQIHPKAPADTILRLLVSLQDSKGKNSQTEKKIKLFEIFNLLNPLDNCYIIRFLTKSLRIGLSEKTIIEVLHEILIKNNHTIDKNTLFTLYATYSNIGHITELVLNNDIESLLFIQPHVGNFIQPQSAEIYIKEKQLLNFIDNTYITQIKLDGFRLQIHINENTIILFSRNGLITNDMFPEIIDAIKKYTNHNFINNAIFDGEIIGFDLEKNAYLSFTQIAQRKRKHNIIDNTNLCKTRFIIFDLLFYNNKSYLNIPYHKRLETINRFENNSEIVAIKSNHIYCLSDIEIQYHKAIEEKQEGIMIKNIYSIYQPGKRTRTWLKYKEVQKDSLEDLIDVVILGFTTAKGSRKDRQKIGSLLVGLYNDQSDSFETLALVGTGGDSTFWKTIEELITPLICHEIPSNVTINKKHIPDYLITPHLIISVKADRVTQSKEHTSGYSIRFPRIITMRLDKNKYQTHCPLLYNNE